MGRNQALGHQACRRGYTVLFTKTSRLHADRTWEERLRRWSRSAALILDDFAMRGFTTTQADDLYDYANSTIMPTRFHAAGI